MDRQIVYLIKGAVWPVSEPVEYTSVEEGRGGGSSVLEALAARVHREHHVQVLHHLHKDQRQHHEQVLHHLHKDYHEHHV